MVSAVAHRRTLVSTFLILAALSGISFVLAGSAQANSPIATYFIRPTNHSTTQAGGHPDVVTEAKFLSHVTQPDPPDCLCDDPKTVVQDFPAGFIGNPHATPQCDAVQLALGSCPVDSQVGIVVVLPGTELGVGTGYFFFPLYNAVPHPGQAGLVAFNLVERTIYTELSARTDSDYGLHAVTTGFPRSIETPYGLTTYLWGVPADPSHDALRYPPTGQGGLHECLVGVGDPRPYIEENVFPPPSECNGEFVDPRHSSSPPIPFISNPTTCQGPLSSSFETIAFDNGTARAETTYPAITGCDKLKFNPSQAAKPTTTGTDSPSGLDVDLKVPQFTSPDTPSPSEIKATTLTLPEGFSINPSASDGKTTCSDAAAKFGTQEAAECPEFAKIGTLSINSSALPGPIPGYMYLGDPQPGDRYRVILVADGYATHIKIAGSAYPDPQTGQLTIRFPNLPQSPLTEFNLHVFGSERGLLATPTQCGTYPVHSTFTPWDESLAEQSSTQFFTLDQGPDGAPCPGRPRGFSPTFDAASAHNTGGEHSAFSVEFNRNDGDQYLSGIEVTTPPGFSATLAGVPYCPEAAIAELGGSGYLGESELASPACPTASQVGTAVASVGAGSRPLYVDGKVYLAGPYKGAPLSLVVVVPAVSGPYDLGNVVVRVAVRIDPETAQVSAVSDALPQIVEGIPLRTRSIQVTLDRPNFALNPTDCEPLAVTAAINGDEGGVDHASSPYQVANCARLPYKPQLSLSLSGGVRRLGHPVIRASFTAEPGEANSKSVSVILPSGEQLDNSHFGNVCTRVLFAQESCPPGSMVGTAEARSPLLENPLKGSVYLRSSSHGLPDIAVALKGQLDITLVGRIDSVKERFRSRFQAVPDVPVSAFNLDLLGGAKGLLQNTESLCGKSKYALVSAVGQNGVQSNSRPKVNVACGDGKRAKHHSYRRAHGGHGEAH